MTATNNGDEIKFDMDHAMVERLQNATGVTPFIVGIHALGSIQQFLEIP